VADTVTMKEAAARLGISNATMWKLVRDGVLEVRRNPLDRRQRLVRVSAIERLRAKGGAVRRPAPRTLGSVSDPELRSDRLEDYIGAHWKPER
jgi:excisionase family DNA binding protein